MEKENRIQQHHYSQMNEPEKASRIPDMSNNPLETITSEIRDINANNNLSILQKGKLRKIAFEKLLKYMAIGDEQKGKAQAILDDRRLAAFKLEMENWFNRTTSQLHKEVTRHQILQTLEISEELEVFQEQLKSSKLSDRKREKLYELAEETFDRVIKRMAERISEMWE